MGRHTGIAHTVALNQKQSPMNTPTSTHGKRRPNNIVDLRKKELADRLLPYVRRGARRTPWRERARGGRKLLLRSGRVATGGASRGNAVDFTGR